MKELTGYKPYDFQKKTIENAVQTVQRSGGVAIFDETGLGKTITGATIAKNVSDGKILIISPKANKASWTNIYQKQSFAQNKRLKTGIMMWLSWMKPTISPM